MSRKKDSQALVEGLAKVISTSPGYGRRLPAGEARRIKDEQARLLEERRANSMRRLLAKQFAPWIAAAVVFVVGAICWLVRWRIDSLTAVTLAFIVGVAACWSAWMVGRRTKKWRGRVHWAAGVASSWLLWTAGAGPSWRAPLVLVVGTVLVSGRWWKAHRIPHPLAPSRETVPVPADQSVPVLWATYLGAQGAILAGTSLSGRDTTKANCESYCVSLVPGKQTFTGTARQLDLIAGGLSTPAERLILEPHSDRNPNHVKLTIVQHSPIEDTMPYRGARLAGDRQNMLEIGPYGDGDGWARWRMWQPGERPMTGSWLSGLIIAGTGIGKSRLMELLAAGYMASGNAVVWFVDPQGGASSPALQEYADWYVSSDGVGRMMGALEQIAAAREKQNSQRKWQRFDPSPERPGIVVFLDECHETIKRYGSKLEALARKTQKVGISFVGLTQGAGLTSLGDDILRASLTANLIVMKTGSNQTKNLLPGLPVDPETLPKIPGFGYSIGTDGSRTAPFRSEYLEVPEDWFRRYPMAKLDALSAKAAGDVYQFRQAAAEEEQERDRLFVEALENGTWVDVAEEAYRIEAEAEDRIDAEGAAGPRAFEVVRFPSAVTPPEKPARDRVLVAVAQGVTRTAEIQKEVGLGKSRLAEVLSDLLASGELERPTAGVYAIAGSASPPVR